MQRSFSNSDVSLKFAVFLVRDRFEPLVRGVFAGNLESEVYEPTVGRCIVPVFHAFRGTVDMPVVAAARPERHIGERNLFGRNPCGVAAAGEILGAGRIRFRWGKSSPAGSALFQF